MRMELTAVYMQVPGGGYVAFAKELWGANSQGETLEEARAMLEDAVRLLIEASRGENEKFIADRNVVHEPLVIDEPGWD
ncbi:type II toxin-antitoxin system HicB family antitoxin [Longimicrobium sp.]|uniref:type II toxin-antitoxin system HicB family antitoxin n=1 Tax=Longimicrobium sp. TaxID=2029185 RepID=UPI002CD0C27A|nr:type II toxin-antitoxin system HicB family antitoxin [Longimicrobium sp.]HSU13621.1 type II toxin-antitoxin system HicB family antitoxin [Longimicrobium sp.]